MTYCTMYVLDMNTVGEHLTSADACQVLHIDRSTLSRWVSSGRIAPAMKLPGVRGPFLFAPEEVERVRIETTEQAS